MASGENKPSYWNDAACDEKHGALCKTKVNPTLPDPPLSPTCEDLGHPDFVKFNGACYKWMDLPKTWDEAEEDCKQQNSHLVSIVNDMEQSFVFSSVKQTQSWIGLTTHVTSIYRNIY